MWSRPVVLRDQWARRGCRSPPFAVRIIYLSATLVLSFKHTEQGLAVVHSPQVASVAHEYPSGSPQTFKDGLELGRSLFLFRRYCRSCLLRIPREERSLGGGEISVRRETGVRTSAQNVSWMGVADISSSGWREAIPTSLRRVFTLRRIASTSCRTDLGQRW